MKIPLRKRYAFPFVAGILLVSFQNASPTSPRSLSSSPRNFVNHDLWAHQLPNLGTNEQMLPHNGVPSATVVDRVATNIGTVHQQGGATAIVLNLTYGAHLLTHWNSSQSYQQWLTQILGPQKKDHYLNPANLDNLIRGKFLGETELLTQIRSKVGTQPRIFGSYRMNDHHHLMGPDEIKNLSALPMPNDPATRAKLRRQIAALSPGYVELVKSAVNHLGTSGDGHFCPRSGSGPSSQDWSPLNFAEMDVINHKYLEIRSLLKRGELNGIELDFSRSYCFFKTGESNALRRVRMLSLLTRVLRDRKALEVAENRAIWLMLKFPDQPLSLIGLSWSDFSASGPLGEFDYLVYTNSVPFKGTTVDIPQELRALRSQNPKLRLIYETFQLSDAIAKVRRNQTRQELATVAAIAREKGFVGFSLFNYHYQTQADEQASSDNRFRWQDLCLVQPDGCQNASPPILHWIGSSVSGEVSLQRSSQQTNWKFSFYKPQSPSSGVETRMQVTMIDLIGDFESCTQPCNPSSRKLRFLRNSDLELSLNGNTLSAPVTLTANIASTGTHKRKLVFEFRLPQTAILDGNNELILSIGTHALPAAEIRGTSVRMNSKP